MWFIILVVIVVIIILIIDFSEDYSTKIEETTYFNDKLSLAKQRIDMLAKLFSPYSPIVFMTTEFKNLSSGNPESDGNLYLFICEDSSFMKRDIEFFSSKCGFSPKQYFEKIKFKNSDYSDEFFSVIDCDLLYSSMFQKDYDKLEIYYPIARIDSLPTGAKKALINKIENYCKTLEANNYNDIGNIS